LSQTELEDLKKIIDSEILKKTKNERLSNQIDNNFIRLLAVYYLFLEKEKIHVSIGFTCCSVLFSMVLPFITIEVIQEIYRSLQSIQEISDMQGSAVIPGGNKLFGY
jgi:hypothetical protein